MNNNKSVYILLLLVSIAISLAIIPHYLVKPFWTMTSPYLVYATLFEMAYTMLILPILLLYISKKIKPSFNHYFVIRWILIVFAIVLSNHFHAQNFDDMTGRGDDPDIGTKILFYAVPAIGILIVSISIARGYFKQKKNLTQ